MQTVTLNHTRLEEVVWPSRCCACDAALEFGRDSKNSLKSPCSWPASLKRGYRMLWDRSGKGGVRVGVCSKCHGKLAIAEGVTHVGVAFFWIAIGGYVLLSMQGRVTPELTMGAGGTFWLGCILCWLADWVQRRILGVKIRRTFTGNWLFCFKSSKFADEFQQNNPDEPNGMVTR